jgi:shikimate dehydrogenase
MQGAALRAAGLREWRYLLVPIPPERFADTVRGLAARGFRGLNVTIPHKEAALALAGEATPAARAIGAANMLTFGPGEAVEADNTDAEGLIGALPASHEPAGRSALVLGAGGAARAAAWALKHAGARDVAVWNRTAERAEALAEDVGVRAVRHPARADILVNCTSVGMKDPDETFKTLPLQADDLGAGSLVVDMVYRPGGTRLLQVAQARGADVVDGLEILVAQGAASFERWTGHSAPRDVMRAAVRDETPS